MNVGDRSYIRTKLECGCILITDIVPLIYEHSGAKFVLSMREASLLTAIECQIHKYNR